jgi:tRNA (guanine37-N1)-methyltransferase
MINKMKIDILTLFPSMFAALDVSVLGKAKQKGILDVNIMDIRTFAKDKHRTADDTPYGGGAGMVMKPELLFEAAKNAGAGSKLCRTILLTPSGKKFNNEISKELAKEKHLILICGHYEGVDERIKELVDDEISIGDYVLTGGELPAMVIVDSVARFIKGVLGDETSAHEESFSNGLLEYPHYTKPSEFEGKKVPEVLLSGDHKKIASWRRKMSVITTFFKRPELLAYAELKKEDKTALESLFTGDIA